MNSATYALFTEWKARKGIHSDNAAALALGVQRQTVHGWKVGRNAELPMVIKMAKDIDEDPHAWAFQVLAERSVGAEKKAIEKMAIELVGRPGLEPGTNRLKVYCSTN